MKIKTISSIIEDFAPPGIAEDYDNVGLLVGEDETEVRSVLVALDITPEVLQEAQNRGANLVISHHPIWFRPRRDLLGNDFVSQQILFAVRNNIALYACHTNLDNIREGVNETIAERLDLRDANFLEPKRGHAPLKDCNAGSGLIGYLPAACTAEELLSKTAQAFGCRVIRHSEVPPHSRIERVAVCGGAGSFLLEAAMHANADAFITSDVTYHKFFDAMTEILYMDIGHYESEQFTTQLLVKFLTERITVPVFGTQTSTNPVRYFLP